MIESYLSENWSAFVGGPPPGHIGVSLISSCTDTFGNMVGLIFLDRARRPEFIIKICRNRAYAHKLEREFWGLAACQMTSALKGRVPRPHHLGRSGDLTFVIQSALHGTSMRDCLLSTKDDDEAMAYLNQAIDALAEIHATPVSEPESVAGLHARQGDDPFCDRDALIRRGVPERIIRNMAQRWGGQMTDGTNRLSHGDYWPNNLLVDKKKRRLTGVFDWEFASGRGFAPTDLMWFLINLSSILYYKRFKQDLSMRDAYAWAFFNDGPHKRRIASLYDRYMQNAPDFNATGFAELLEMTLAELSIREQATYGKARTMDDVCFGMLTHALENQKQLIF